MTTRTATRLRASAFAGLLATTLCVTTMSPTTWAAPESGKHHGMVKEGHGKSHGRALHGLRPHNAAEHFLKLTDDLKLTDEQVQRLTALRDDYAAKNAQAEAEYKAAFADLGRALFADDIDMNRVNPLLEQIGKLDAQLWPAFAQQLHDVKALLTSEQKSALRAKWEERHKKMERKSGDKPE